MIDGRSKRKLSAYKRVMRRTKIPKDKTKCWLWCGPVNNAGFGLIKGDEANQQRKMVSVHRVVAKEHGLDIDNNQVQHTCLVSHCVNPDHLVLGTARDRVERIIKKHGRNFALPKNPYKTCEHCNRTDHVVWFSRKHKDCYPGMMNKYYEYLRKKV